MILSVDVGYRNLAFAIGKINARHKLCLLTCDVVDALNGKKKRTNEHTIKCVLDVMKRIRSEYKIDTVICERQVRASPLNQGISHAINGFWHGSDSEFIYMRPKDKFLACSYARAEMEPNLKKRSVLEVQHLLNTGDNLLDLTTCEDLKEKIFKHKKKRDDLCDVILQFHSFIHQNYHRDFCKKDVQDLHCFGPCGLCREPLGTGTVCVPENGSLVQGP